MLKLIGIRCNDRRPENGLFGGYASWEHLLAAMSRQNQEPFEKRLRPCLKHRDWWIYQAQVCVQCEKAIWDLEVDGDAVIAKLRSFSKGVSEILCERTGEIFFWCREKGLMENEKA